MLESGKKDQENNKITKVKAFPVPFSLGEIKKNFSISTNTHTKLSKKQIINQAFKLHSQGNILQAAKYYQDLINQGCNDSGVFSNYGVILKSFGKSEEAELLLRKAIELNPNCPESHCNLGNVLKDFGKLKDAALLLRKAIKLKPNFANAYSNLAIILKDLGNLKEAELSIRKAIEINPNDAIAHSNLGNILSELGNLKEADLSLRKAIELKPDFTNAYLDRGMVLRGLGKLKEGELSTRKAIELKPNAAEPYCNLGIILKDLGELQKAEITFTKAISMKPDFTNAIMNRWQLRFDQGKLDLALKDSDDCNTKLSRACSIETLYSLGRIEEIYERIKTNLELDEKNIRLAAFSSFLSEVEKRNTGHKFCCNPLSFIHFSNIKFHLKNHTHFITDIINELRTIKTIWEPLNKTTHNGFQTPTNINLFSNSSKEISQIKSIILNELDAYYSKFEKESCSYIQKWPSNKKLIGWHVILKKQGYQSAHIHPGGWLSGVIYLKVVPPLGKDEGAIEFSLNGPNYFNVNSPKLTYQPQLGEIVLFPSSLHHRTIPFSTDTDRIVIAFDLIPD